MIYAATQNHGLGSVWVANEAEFRFCLLGSKPCCQSAADWLAGRTSTLRCPFLPRGEVAGGLSCPLEGWFGGRASKRLCAAPSACFNANGLPRCFRRSPGIPRRPPRSAEPRRSSRSLDLKALGRFLAAQRDQASREEPARRPHDALPDQSSRGVLVRGLDHAMW